MPWCQRIMYITCLLAYIAWFSSHWFGFTNKICKCNTSSTQSSFKSSQTAQNLTERLQHNWSDLHSHITIFLWEELSSWLVRHSRTWMQFNPKWTWKLFGSLLWSRIWNHRLNHRRRLRLSVSLVLRSALQTLCKTNRKTFL